MIPYRVSFLSRNLTLFIYIGFAYIWRWDFNMTNTFCCLQMNFENISDFNWSMELCFKHTSSTNYISFAKCSYNFPFWESISPRRRVCIWRIEECSTWSVNTRQAVNYKIKYSSVVKTHLLKPLIQSQIIIIGNNNVDSRKEQWQNVFECQESPEIKISFLLYESVSALC